MSASIVAKRPVGALRDRLLEGTFRANPGWELARFEELSADEQQLLGPLCQDNDFCGVIRPRSKNGLTAKAICRKTAELFECLRHAGPLPSFVVNDELLVREITGLVCDGILQVADGFAWVCGPAAMSVPDEFAYSAAGKGALANLSLQALQHTASLATADASEISACLYQYNTLPLTPRWLRRLPDQATIEECMGIDIGGRNRRTLDRGWTRVLTQVDNDHWLAWNSRTLTGEPETISYKLYLSPHPTFLQEAFDVWLPVITGLALHFKIGGNIRGLLRPDKMVAYFGDFFSLKNAAVAVSRQLPGCSAQGVPFTTQLDSDGLLSWGSDPPTDEAAPVWLRRQSWRQWICHRLGSALAMAKHQKCKTLPAWQFALQRVGMEGVDVATWSRPSGYESGTPGDVA